MVLNYILVGCPCILYGDRNNSPLIPLFRQKNDRSLSLHSKRFRASSSRKLGRTLATQATGPFICFKLCNSIKFQKTRKQIKMTRKHSFFDAFCCIRIVSDTLKERQYNIKLNLILRQHQTWLYERT